ncbi:granulocyte colony-stimulating factor receptor [Leptodactylus fuscus]|uniref:granulocyte colony-stimulating factor receptor n=1 Tax=Leptodactylus fuscus TaxID=238119 RepID=UPI003F4EF7B8
MHKALGVLQVLLLHFIAEGVQACHITIASSVIQRGSPLSASCDCPRLRKGEYEVVWKLDNDTVPCNSSSNAQAGSCPLHFTSFNKTSGLLQCYASNHDGLLLLDQITIKAGYPPTPPTNLSCLMNISQNILNCTWKLQNSSLLEENITLSTFRTNSKCTTHSDSEYRCSPSNGDNFCIISRKYFNAFGELAVQVTAENKIGSATSSLLCLIPIMEVKLEPIVIKAAIPHKDCVTLQWTYGKKEDFLKKDMRCQLQYKEATEMKWTGLVEKTDVKTLDQCGLLGGTKYDFQIRCIRINLTGQWSEWGPTTSVITEESAPTGKLETWWRTLESSHNTTMKIQLLWKQLERNKANADNLWYIVKSSSHQHDSDTILCNTTAFNCTIALPTDKSTVFISAYNSAGASPETKIIFTARNGTPVSKTQVTSIGDSSLHVMWNPQRSAEGYLLEWYKSMELPNNEIYWRTEQKKSSSLILQDIQPFQRYTVRVYPLYKDCIGMFRETEVYSKEGAPDFSPEIILLNVTKSQAVIQWKPIPVQRSNGFITNYTVFWIDTSGKTQSATLQASTTKYNITNLLPSTTYQVFIRSSTSGGSVNGTTIMIHTTVLDTEDVNMMLLTFILFGFLAIIFMIIICLVKHKRMKNRFWPVVPDPANSKMGNLAFFLEETPKMTFNINDFHQTITSELNIVEGKQRNNPPLENVNHTTFEDYGHAYNKQMSPSTEEPSKSRYYVNVDTVQYAKVITAGYREQSPPTSVYVRSDSTQPLLYDVSPSPKNYQNTWFHFSSHEDSVFLMEEENMKDFPLLKALQLHEE